MQLTNLTLDKWLHQAPESLYPNHRKFDYHTLYAALKIRTADLHKNVVATGNYQERLKSEGRIDILLNDHGEEHITRVVQRASELLALSFKNSNFLTPKEVYFLLCAIEVHDLGNHYGRAGHETNVGKIISELKESIGSDDVERIIIRKLAEAHGGRATDGDKDKINRLEKETNVSNETVRTQLLAALLRFADELADDKTRVNVFALNNNLIPKSSEIYHAYSKCLDSVKVSPETQTISLDFQIPVEYAIKKFGKEESDVYLVDEIYSRVLKMHHERIYTMHFMKGFCDIEKIWVRIRFYKSFMDGETLPEITFTVSQKGYPGENGISLYEICRELTHANGKKMDGEYYMNILNKS